MATMPLFRRLSPVPEPHLEEVASGVYAFLQPDWRWGLNNAVFLVGPEGVVLVDTCFTEERTRRLLGAVRSVTDRPIRLLINTHHHGDHTYGNCLVPEAVAMAHPFVRKHIQAMGLGLRAFFPEVEMGDLTPRPPEVTFAEPLTLYLGDRRVDLIPVGPAHTPGDVVVWLPEERVLLAGDLFFKGSTPFFAEGSLFRYGDALARVRALQPRVIVPGHGPLCGPEVVEETEGYLRFVEGLAREGFAEGRPPLEVARGADLGPYRDWPEWERLVGNLHRAYSELRGEPPAHPLDYRVVLPEMVAFRGGPMNCL